jgi:hypothetical protein
MKKRRQFWLDSNNHMEVQYSAVTVAPCNRAHVGDNNAGSFGHVTYLSNPLLSNFERHLHFYHVILRLRSPDGTDSIMQ